MGLTEQTRRNIEIAKMMGRVKHNAADKHRYDKPTLANFIYFEDTDLAYHTDAWLMPVIRKISEMVCPDVWNSQMFYHLRYDVIKLPCYTETIKLFIAVSDFAEWYNNQSK